MQIYLARFVTAFMASTLSLFSLTSCSGSASSDNADPTQSPDTLTVEQFAAQISPIRETVDEALQSWEDDTCSSLAVGEGDFVCAANAYSAALDSQTVLLQLETITNRDSPEYVGQVPDELSGLYEDTLSAARLASEAGKTFEDNDCMNKNCVAETFDVIDQLENLSEEFDKWDPYL